MKEKILAYDMKKKKYVLCGILDDDVFIKQAKSCHFMRINNSFGISEDVVWRLKEKGCKYLEIHTTTNKLCCAFSDILSSDIKVQNFGHGSQRFIPLNRLYKGLL